jgi:hypothetical protein
LNFGKLVLPQPNIQYLFDLPLLLDQAFDVMFDGRGIRILSFEYLPSVPVLLLLDPLILPLEVSDGHVTVDVLGKPLIERNLRLLATQALQSVVS